MYTSETAREEIFRQITRRDTVSTEDKPNFFRLVFIIYHRLECNIQAENLTNAEVEILERCAVAFLLILYFDMRPFKATKHKKCGCTVQTRDDNTDS
ncbi:hypothetical protein PENTCL1PPCAC_9419, partial [Pristionchus entomophagus]